MESEKKISEKNNESDTDIFIIYDEDHSKMTEKVEKELYERELELIFVVIMEIPDVKSLLALIKEGFLPKLEKDIFKEALIDYLIEGYTREEIKFWTGETVDIDKVLNEMLRYHIFQYGTISGWEKYALKTANSLPLALYAKHLLYPSMRPINNMAMFRQVTSALYTHAVKIDDYIYSLKSISSDGKEIELGFGVPVTRYSDGMSRGLYYNGNGDSNNTRKYCGTFYYYEPASTTFLTFSNHSIYRNKHEAIKILTKRKKFFDELSPLDIYYNSQYYRIRVGEFPENLRMTPREYYSEIIKMNIPAAYDELSERKYYIGKVIGFYGMEDDYDQELCALSKKENYEIVILTHMVGSRQVVTEILDVRERSLSFGSLVYPMQSL